MLTSGMFRPTKKSARSGAFAIGDLQTAAKFATCEARLGCLAMRAKVLEFPGSRKSFARNRIASDSDFVLSQSDGSACSARIDNDNVPQLRAAQIPDLIDKHAVVVDQLN